jgi:tellurite resistance-related uncharacterized protein/uncharacterized protein (DUF2249 family)
MDAFDPNANNLRKPALELPQGYAFFTRTPIFEQLVLPEGLQNSHRTSYGVWGEIVVESGLLRYDWLDGSGESWYLGEGDVGVIPAELPHRIEPISDDARFYLQLYRAGEDRSQCMPDPGASGVLDLRTLPTPLRHQQVFNAFDALSPGESLVFISDRDPRPLLGRFTVLRRHRFLWLPQAAAVGRWIVSLSRREDDFAPTIGEALQADHDRLDALLDLSIEKVAAGESADDALSDFCWGLRRHFRIEEQYLFPKFVEVGGPAEAVQVMAGEHRDVVREIELFETHLMPTESALKHLQQVLYHHNFKKDGVLYPMLDVSLGRQRLDLVKTIFREIDWRSLSN